MAAWCTTQFEVSRRTKEERNKTNGRNSKFGLFACAVDPLRIWLLCLRVCGFVCVVGTLNMRSTTMATIATIMCRCCLFHAVAMTFVCRYFGCVLSSTCATLASHKQSNWGRENKTRANWYSRANRYKNSWKSQPLTEYTERENVLCLQEKESNLARTMKLGNSETDPHVVYPHVACTAHRTRFKNDHMKNNWIQCIWNGLKIVNKI